MYSFHSVLKHGAAMLNYKLGVKMFKLNTPSIQKCMEMGKRSTYLCLFFEKHIEYVNK